MPVINLAGRLGGAGDAAAAVTQQLNQGMALQLQLAQLQDRRRAQAQEVSFRERQLAEQFSLGRAQEARLGRLADAQIALSDARAGAASMQSILGPRGTAARGAQRTSVAYPVSGQGIGMRMLALQELDPQLAEQADAWLLQATQGRYAEVPDEQKAGLLDQDQMLPAYAIKLDQLLGDAEYARRLDSAGVRLKTQAFGLAARAQALGDEQFSKSIEERLGLEMPSAEADDEAKLDFADTRWPKVREEIRQQIETHGERLRLRARLDEKLSREGVDLHMPVNGISGMTLGQIVGEAREKMESADTVGDVRAAYAGALPLIDPEAQMVQEFTVSSMLANPALQGALAPQVTGPNGLGPAEPASIAGDSPLMQVLGTPEQQETATIMAEARAQGVDLKDPAAFEAFMQRRDDAAARRKGTEQSVYSDAGAFADPWHVPMFQPEAAVVPRTPTALDNLANQPPPGAPGDTAAINRSRQILPQSARSKGRR